MLGKMGRGKGTEGEMGSSALFHALSGKGQIIRVRKAVLLDVGLSHGERICTEGRFGEQDCEGP